MSPAGGQRQPRGARLVELHLRLPEAVVDALFGLADAQGVTAAHLVRGILARHLEGAAPACGACGHAHAAAEHGQDLGCGAPGCRCGRWAPGRERCGAPGGSEG